jgi:hypothetical protein
LGVEIEIASALGVLGMQPNNGERDPLA